jgi:hypothetical protein
VLWRNQANGSDKSCYLVMVYLLFQLVYAQTYASSAMFFLTRAYEGKAFVANVIVPLILYLCAEYAVSREKKIFGLLFAAFWGATAMSTSGTAIAAMEIAVFIAACLGMRILEKIKGRKHV